MTNWWWSWLRGSWRKRSFS